MGFFHQLRLLLWKNFTLKKRRPFVLLFEVFIPLVLFVILLLIRKKLPASPISTSRYTAKPLPSAGLVSLLQMFCEGGQRDEHGFMNFSNSKSTEKFLNQLQAVALHHNFFIPGFTAQEMDELPDLYRSVINDPAFLHDQFISAKNIGLDDVLSNASTVAKFMTLDLSLPSKEVEALVHSTVNVQMIYKYLFGGDLNSSIIPLIRMRRSPVSLDDLQKGASALLPPSIVSSLLNNSGSGFGAITAAEFAGILKVLQAQALAQLQSSVLMESLVKTLLEHQELLSRGNMLTVLELLLKTVESQGLSLVLQPDHIARLLKMFILSPFVLHSIACNDAVFTHLLQPSVSYNITVAEQANIQHLLCSLNASQLLQMSNVFSSEITDEKIVQILNLHAVNLSATALKVHRFLDKVEKFILFQRELEELGTFVEMLPFGDNLTDSLTGNQTATDQSFNITNNVTPTDSKDSENGHPSKKNWKPSLMRIWNFMQIAVCGKKPKALTPAQSQGSNTDDEDIDALALSSRQKDMLGIIIHYLYSNPKIIYAPNNTAADSIISKANATFQFVGAIGDYAREWLNISQELREFLHMPKTEHNLQAIKEMQDDLRKHNGVIWWLFKLPQLSPFLSEPVHNSSQYIHMVDMIDKAAQGWLNLIEGISLNVFEGFESEEDMVNYFLTQAYAENVSVIAGVVFEDMLPGTSLPPHVRYKIRQNATFTPTTKYVRKQTWYPGPGPGTYPYYQFGFVWVQDLIERAIVDLQVGREVIEPGTYTQQFPYPCYVYDQFVFMIEHVMPLCLTISWVYSVAMLVQSIVYEKEHRLKEVMKMMGLSNAVHWCAWFLTTWIQMTATVAILTAMLKLGKVLPHSEVAIVFIVLEVYAIAIISFSFLISVLYSKAKVAAACAGIIYFLSYVPYMYLAIKEDIAGDKIPAVYKTVASLFSTTAFGVGAKYFAFYEEMGVGVRWDNIGISPVEDDQYNLLMVTLMMVLDSLIYAVLVWYIEHVHPGSYGLPKPWYFPFTKSYWCGGTMRIVEECSNPFSLCHRRNRGYLSVMEEDQACAMAQQDPEHARRFEPEPVHLPLGVCIDNLTKVYKLGRKVAVKQLSLNLYEGHITSFLGHNGAGKTTTMSMLSGLIPPTQGYATIYGMDIRTDMDVIRQSLGMCPQHNVLFDKFTVEEHLWFYAHLKGMNNKDIQQETDRIIEDLGLPDRKHSRVDCLSGGMQRKLSVAIAFIGGSQTVILDEPTAGVDPYARRAIWDLLVKYKQGRTILLSTHYMDEADILGDRIAIISNGQLKCCGSSMFLKNNIGDGYHLILVKAEGGEIHLEEAEDDDDKLLDEDHVRSQHISPCNSDSVGSFIQKYMPSAYLMSESPRELHYILPFEEAKKGNFRKLFEALDSSLVDLHVNSYGIMDTTLEEIFLKITEAACQEEEAQDEGSKAADALTTNSTQVTPASSVSGSSSPDSYDDPLNSLIEPATVEEQGLLMEGGFMGDLQSSSGGSVTGGPVGHQSGERRIADLNAMASPVLGNERLNEQGAQSNSSFQEAISSNQHLSQRTQSQLPSFSQQRPVVTSFNYIHDSANSPRILLEGRGSHMLKPHLLLLSHFKAVIIKRFHYITRNWRSLFSQIILPAIFVAIAMTVALAAPSVDDLPPIELSTLQYYNVTHLGGNFVPITNERMSSRSKVNPDDAVASRLMETFKLASGIGASCVLQLPQSTPGLLMDLNSWQDPAYDPSCQWLIDLQQKVETIPILTEESNQTDFTPLEPSFSQKHYYPSCHCASDGSQYECVNNNHEKPPSFRVITQDWLVNITGQKAEDYLLYTTYDKRLHRYGAVSFGLLRKDIPENFGESAPTLYKKLAVRNVAKVWFNHKGYHSMPVFLNAINNAILRANLPSKKGNPAAYGITAVNHPWNDTNNVLNTMNFVLEGSDVLISIFIIVAMSFVPASFVVFLVYERSTKAKHLQFVTGINPVMYWIGNYTWDMANYVIPAFMCVMILLIFQIPAYVSTDNLPAVIALFLMYGWSITPVMYPASFWFNEPSTAYICLIVINLFTGITCIVSSFLLEIFSYDKDLERVHNVLKIVFMLFPNYCLGRGLIDLAFNEYKNEYYFKTGQNDLMTSPMQWELIPRLLVAMASIGLAFFFITLLCEYRFFLPGRQRTTSQQATVENEDYDVAMERKRVLRGSGKYDVLRLENLTKVYKTRKLGRHLAVNKLCLGVPPGECFGLLGVNGAGKTTTFKMLTGDIPPTAGGAYLNGHSIVKDIKKVQHNIGYCPQFDCLYDELTAREHLQLYCRLRGVPPKDEKQVVEWALNKLGLAKYADKLSGTYSGGCKRKLSTAIALIGHPPVIFMDEPTTGMDPHSRRFLWNLILSLIQDGRSVILTSHSMEECEILCTRLAIMVNGRFQCLGSTQHLKNKFGEGYTFSIRVAGPDYEHNQREIIRFIERNIPSASLKEQHYNLVQYELKARPVSLGDLFEKLEQAQQDLHVEDYSVSQNTLDNVFINFVKKQVEIVRDEEEPIQQVRRPWLLGRSRARCQPIFDDSAGTEDVQPLLGSNRISDGLELSDDDDDLMLQFDQSNGTRLTLMPL